jgi:hypothetical protein
VATVVVRIDNVRREIKAICESSQRVKHLVHEALKRVQSDPGAYEEISEVPECIVGRENVFIRKVDITHQKHDYRMVYIHQIREDGSQRADFLYARPRRDDYRSLDWPGIAEFILGL